MPNFKGKNAQLAGALSHPNLVQVDLCGVITMYKPPAEDVLETSDGGGDDASMSGSDATEAGEAVPADAAATDEAAGEEGTETAEPATTDEAASEAPAEPAEGDAAPTDEAAAEESAAGETTETEPTPRHPSNRELSRFRGCSLRGRRLVIQTTGNMSTRRTNGR